MLDRIKNELKNRLNIEYDKQHLLNSKNYLTFNILKTKFFKNQINEYMLPSTLITDGAKLIKKYFKDLPLKQQKTKFEQLLFIPIVLFNHILRCSNEDKERLTYAIGYQLSKDLLTSVMSPHDLYVIKNILIEEKIISNVMWEDGYKFSIDEKKAMKYVLNCKYKLINDLKVIKNKYAARFQLLINNGFMFGTKKLSLYENFMPYESFNKNLQYFYQKQMYFDDESFFQIFNQKYPDGMAIINGEKKCDLDLYREISIAYSFYNALKFHTFKASESFGRIYMPFQCISKDFRKCIRIGHNESIFELFDIHCCFINLSAKIIKEKTDKYLLKNECDEIIKLTLNDIYTDIINFNNIENEVTRSDVKKSVMGWLFSNKVERSYFIKTFNNIKYIDNYFKNKFPLFYNEIINYQMLKKELIKDGEVKEKYVSKLSSECFQKESDLMLETIIPILHNEYKDIPFISLHDAIFIPESFKYKTSELKNRILQLIQRIKNDKIIINNSNKIEKNNLLWK